MTSETVSVTEFKQNLSSIINRAAFGGERIVLLSHGKERAALISIEDLRLLETLHAQSGRALYQQQQLQLLEEARQLRESAGGDTYEVDVVELVEEARNERLDDLTDLR